MPDGFHIADEEIQYLLSSLNQNNKMKCLFSLHGYIITMNRNKIPLKRQELKFQLIVSKPIVNRHLINLQ